MGRINILDTQVSDKIAAGEVVERPASVVKELVENAIDAGANKIIVEIKKGGSTYIRVTDNGCGMEKDDAAVAFLRHATSKISTASDLDAIHTLGFRGEALSSISAVSMVDLYTKRREDEFGTHTVAKAGEIISDNDAGIPDGTTFIVKNLFYNVPARMKFLKKDTTEAAYITDIITRFILANPQISFKLINNGKETLYSSGDSNLKNSIYSVYGKDYAASMLDCHYETEYVTISGMTGKASTARPNRNYQSFFVNSRYIKSPLIMRAVEEAYKNQLMKGKYPVTVLNIQINPALIDINVHPTKLEVKFSNENEVYKAVYHAIFDALYKITDIPEIKKPEPKTSINEEPVFKKDKIIADAQIKIDIEKPIKKSVVDFNQEKEIKTIFDTPSLVVKSPKILQPKEINLEEIPKKTQIIKPLYEEKVDTSQKEETVENAEKTTNITYQEPKENQAQNVQKPYNNTEFALIGQVFDTYIIIEKDNSMLMIDQHAAHERLNYEDLKVKLNQKDVYSQGLLIPCIVDLSASEMAQFLQNIEFFSKLGFEVEEFGNNSVIIRSVPINAMTEDISDLFIEILSQLEENKREIVSQKFERLIYTIACKASVKANSKLDKTEQEELVKKVLELENINTCPHGRPIIISMSKTEIEKQFKRII